jgi:methyltransferase (TIGR00027 family)
LVQASTRAFRLPRLGQIRCFEVDTPQTQAAKRQLLHKVGIDVTGIRFVAADFETEDWLARLVEAGFDPLEPAVFLWEGVIMHLDRPAVESTLLGMYAYMAARAAELPLLAWRLVRSARRRRWWRPGGRPGR